MSLLTATRARNLTDLEAEIYEHDWDQWARENQREPHGKWIYWLILAGRGYGKTRIGAEAVRRWAQTFDAVNIIGATADDARDIMIEGESGIQAVCPSWERPEYQPSKRRLTWPNGNKTLIFTADEPERLRGKQHRRIWADELAAWRYAEESWDQAMLGLRLPPDPRAIVTTTPRPIKALRDLINNPDTVIVGGNTYENRDNLAETFYTNIIRKYEGTRLGRQELMAELLDDVEGALWTRARIDAGRVAEPPAELDRIVVGVDPNASSDEGANEAGIIVAGVGHNDQHGYVLEDATTRGGPEAWAQASVDAYHRWEADTIVAEKNNGGDMVSMVIKNVDVSVGVSLVWASRGKRTRAEPVAQLYEQQRIHHVGGELELVEDQMCTWVPDSVSPDRMDALVWAMTDLMLKNFGKAEGRQTRDYTLPERRRGDLVLKGSRYVDK